MRPRARSCSKATTPVPAGGVEVGDVVGSGGHDLAMVAAAEGAVVGAVGRAAEPAIAIPTIEVWGLAMEGWSETLAGER